MTKKRHIYGNTKLESPKKKTSQGSGKFTKYGSPGPYGGNKGYKKKSRGQGKAR
jgi:hypothetical protein